MRVAVTGATGNVGTSVVDALIGHPAITSVVGLARRTPRPAADGVEWRAADITGADLTEIFEGVDVVVHLAWLIQPSRDPGAMRAVNVRGSERVFHAAIDAGVRRLVHASSVGVYSPGRSDERIGEDHPRDGITTSAYSRDKVDAERALDSVEAKSDLEVVRLRPGLIFKREAASEIRRYFAGPLFPGRLVRDGLIPIVPDIEGLAFQAVHTDDVAEAYLQAVVSDAAGGAYNIAADPVIDPRAIAAMLGARRVRVPRWAVARLVQASWRLRLQPTDASWLDLAIDSPLMDTGRARDQLGFAARQSGLEALRELLDGIRDRAGGTTPPLDPDAGGPLRLRELLTGVGGRSR